MPLRSNPMLMSHSDFPQIIIRIVSFWHQLSDQHSFNFSYTPCQWSYIRNQHFRFGPSDTTRLKCFAAALALISKVSKCILFSCSPQLVAPSKTSKNPSWYWYPAIWISRLSITSMINGRNRRWPTINLHGPRWQPSIADFPVQWILIFSCKKSSFKPSFSWRVVSTSPFSRVRYPIGVLRNGYRGSG